MLRFLVTRLLSAIPLLLILSIVTFAIIQAPPGNYADYIRSQLMNLGGASFEQADAQAKAYAVAHGLDKPLVIQQQVFSTSLILLPNFEETSQSTGRFIPGMVY